MADARDLKSLGFTAVSVRVRSAAPQKTESSLWLLSVFWVKFALAGKWCLLGKWSLPQRASEVCFASDECAPRKWWRGTKKAKGVTKNIIIKTKYILFFLVIYSISCYNKWNNRLQPIKAFTDKAYNDGFVAVKKIRSEEGIQLSNHGLVEFNPELVNMV